MQFNVGAFPNHVFFHLKNVSRFTGDDKVVRRRGSRVPIYFPFRQEGNATVPNPQCRNSVVAVCVQGFAGFHQADAVVEVALFENELQRVTFQNVRKSCHVVHFVVNV